jgi:hypothetical protein
MSSFTALALLVALPLVLTGLAIAGGLAYVAHRRPSLCQPITIALDAFTVFSGIVFGILQLVMP